MLAWNNIHVIQNEKNPIFVRVGLLSSFNMPVAWPETC